jgi:hypothetical protein
MLYILVLQTSVTTDPNSNNFIVLCVRICTYTIANLLTYLLHGAESLLRS